MKAVLCKAFGPVSSLVLEGIANPSPAKNEVLLDVHAAKINFPGTLIIEGKYQFEPPSPSSPGGKAAGVVVVVGGKVAHVRPGGRVMALVGWDNFAEQIKVPGYNVMPISGGMDFASAATFSMTYGISVRALKQRANLRPGETLLVLGTSGGVGLTAVKIGKTTDARMIAAVNTPDKLVVAKATGANGLINYSEDSLREQLKALAGGQDVDMICDSVGGELFKKAFRNIAWNERMLVIDSAGGSIPSLPANLTLLKGTSLVGVFWGSFTQRRPRDNADNFRQLFAWRAEGKLKPLVSQHFPLKRTGDAIDALGQRKAIGKVVVGAR